MGLFDNGGGFLEVGSVEVKTTENRGLTAEEWAERCLKHIVHVADDSESPIRDQAMAFKDDIRRVLVAYMKRAIQSDRTTIYNLLLQQNEREMAEIIRKL
jgi:hypothetical protein